MLFDSFMVWQQIVLWWTTGSPLSLIGIEVRSLYIQLKDNLTSGLNVQYYIDNSGGTKASILLFNNFSCHCITVEMCLEWKARKKKEHVIVENLENRHFTEIQWISSLLKEWMAFFFIANVWVCWHDTGAYSVAWQKLIHIQGCTSGCIRLGMSSVSAMRRSFESGKTTAWNWNILVWLDFTHVCNFVNASKQKA